MQKKSLFLLILAIFLIVIAGILVIAGAYTSTPLLNSEGIIPSSYGYHELRFVSNGSDGYSVDANEDGVIDIAERALSGAGLWSESGSNIYYDGGNVGIGTDSPSTKLQVKGGAINASGGLIIQQVHSQEEEDELNPAVGQIWLRTDIS